MSGSPVHRPCPLCWVPEDQKAETPEIKHVTLRKLHRAIAKVEAEDERIGVIGRGTFAERLWRMLS